MAHLRHVSTTSQRRQTAFASSIWRSAGPVFPMGKNSSGSSSRQAARWRQSMFVSPSGRGEPGREVMTRRWATRQGAARAKGSRRGG
ncbi:Uncharacterised protein [Mycobacteroides abscessus]|nr:Uncharacterised protein [Mycobacteroides abscessus]